MLRVVVFDGCSDFWFWYVFVCVAYTLFSFMVGVVSAFGAILAQGLVFWWV